ncbi:MAG: hypothetical protein LBB93_02950, partial [Elusimicrobiota bacterium]|nr:hypothetical protein [Elusimicrobiota bacterium]
MKKAVIAVAAVLVFIFTITQKSGAADAGTWSDLSDLHTDTNYYYTSPIELTDNITSDSSFALFTLKTDKKTNPAHFSNPAPQSPVPFRVVRPPFHYPVNDHTGGFETLPYIGR